MVLTAHTTGSGEKTPFIFIDGVTASQDYGVSLLYAPQCPNCHFPINQLLAFNPVNSYRYIAPCPVCGKYIEYMDNTGNLASLKILSSKKTTPVDQDLDVSDRY